MPAFPDALGLLLICVESGMSIELAFGKVAGEMATSSIELAEELSLTTAELSYLKLTVPMILFFLPVLFIVILTPAAMRLGGAF